MWGLSCAQGLSSGPSAMLQGRSVLSQGGGRRSRASSIKGPQEEPLSIRRVDFVSVKQKLWWWVVQFRETFRVIAFYRHQKTLSMC